MAINVINKIKVCPTYKDANELYIYTVVERDHYNHSIVYKIHESYLTIELANKRITQLKNFIKEFPNNLIATIPEMLDIRTEVLNCDNY